MECKDLVIINDWDRPCMRLLMGVKEDGTAMYINRQVKKNYTTNFPVGQPGCNSLEEFGFSMCYDELLQDYRYKQTQPSQATYPDGRIREWQDVSEFTLTHAISQELS